MILSIEFVDKASRSQLTSELSVLSSLFIGGTRQYKATCFASAATSPVCVSHSLIACAQVVYPEGQHKKMGQ
jgi:hypothetical protein